MSTQCGAGDGCSCHTCRGSHIPTWGHAGTGTEHFGERQVELPGLAVSEAGSLCSGWHWPHTGSPPAVPIPPSCFSQAAYGSSQRQLCGVAWLPPEVCGGGWGRGCRPTQKQAAPHNPVFSDFFCWGSLGFIGASKTCPGGIIPGPPQSQQS